MIGKRIHELRKLRGLSQEELAAKARLARPYLSRLENNHSQPTVETLESLARAMDLEMSAFFTGGEPEVSFSAAEMPGRSVPVFDPGAGRDICASIFQSVSDGERPVGEGEASERASTRDPNAFYVVARGRSMTGGAGRRSIEEGDLLLVEPNRGVRDGDIVLCRRPDGAGSEVLVKMFKRMDDGRAALVALNPDYPPVVLSAEEAAAAAFYRVTEIKRKL